METGARMESKNVPFQQTYYFFVTREDNKQRLGIVVISGVMSENIQTSNE